MRIHRLPVLAASALTLVAMHPPGAWAQSAPDAAPASRAARDAENPMRMIIEASKLKVRIKADGDAGDANAPEKRAAPRPAAAPAPKPVAAAPSKAASAVVAKAPAAGTSAPAAPEVQAAPPAPAPAPEPVVAKAPEAAPPTLAVPAPLIPVPKPQAAAPAPLKLVRMVEPTLSDYALRRLRTDTEVVVGFTVNADGSVSNVAIRSTPNKVLDQPVAEAVSQWRYQPPGEVRSHAVQLLLRAGPLPQ